MKPGKMTCAGLVGIMIVLPSSLWKPGPVRRVIPRVVIREASVEAAESDGKDASRSVDGLSH